MTLPYLRINTVIVRSLFLTTRLDSVLKYRILKVKLTGKFSDPDPSLNPIEMGKLKNSKIESNLLIRYPGYAL